VVPKSWNWLKIYVGSQQTFRWFKRALDNERLYLLSNISSSGSLSIQFGVNLSTVCKTRVSAALLLSLSRHPPWMTWIIKHSRMIVYLGILPSCWQRCDILYAPHFKMITCRVNKLKLWFTSTSRLPDRENRKMCRVRGHCDVWICINLFIPFRVTYFTEWFTEHLIMTHWWRGVKSNRDKKAQSDLKYVWT